MFGKMKPRAPMTTPQDHKVIPADAPSPIVAGAIKAARSVPLDVPALSSIQADVLVDGNLISQGDLHLHGTIRGDVKVAHLVVGETGNIEGKVEAETIEVRGRIIGSIQGRQVKLLASAYVEGDILHDKLSIDVGAFFQGCCQQRRRVEATAATAQQPSTPAPTAPNVPNLDAYDINALSDLK